MRWRRNCGMEVLWTVLVFSLATIGVCDGARRTAQRRKDTARAPELYVPEPSAESLQAIAQAMGAAGFEHYTEGRALVKRLIPANSQPDLDVVEHQGVIGRAGVDFPAYPNIPSTGFNCKNVPTGYYADLETDCQVFHICDTSRKISFLCPNGTIFSQSHLICDWWFKVDCASAPALYESSAEHYSNEQKKSQKITQSLSKNQDLQQLAETNIRAETRRPVAPVSSTTERIYRGRQRQQNDTPYVPQATARSYQALFPDPNYKNNNNNNPTQRSQLSTAFEKRKKSLVQLITNNFALPARSTSPTYPEASTLKSTADYSLKEMQVAAESASFANNNNRQFLQDYHTKNYRPYPVYTPNTTTKKPEKTRIRTNPNLTTLYDIREKQPSQNHYTHVAPPSTKRPTLVTYTKSYTTINDNPYTRPGVSLLKGFIEKEKNRTATTAAAKKHTPVTESTEPIEIKKVTVQPRDTFESVTKIPTTRSDIGVYTQAASSDRYDVISTANHIEGTTEPSYKERRERLMRKLNLDVYGPTESTIPTAEAKSSIDQSNTEEAAVPPSLTPKTLHSLAIYYATALDNLSTTSNPDETEVTTPAFDEYEAMEEALPALFSSSTVNKYSSLFGHGASNAELLEEIKADPNGTYNELMEDLMVQQSQSPLATSPQIRELAQVFTHALSAYLQDPVQFRKVLSDIRPTHPSFGDSYSDAVGTTEDNTEPTTTVNEEDEEILGFSEDNKARPISALREPKALDLGTKFQNIPNDPKYQTFSDNTKFQTISDNSNFQTISDNTQYQTISTASQFQTTPIDVSTTPRPTEFVSSTYRSTTPRNPFICCGRISASYTSPSTPYVPSTPVPYTNTNAYTINSLAINEVSTTENTVPRYGGFQNNALTISDSPYGTGVTETKPLSEYVEATNLPTAWGIDASASTSVPTTQDFESKKIRTTTFVPTTTTVYFTETDSVELENEEELQRAHSQSFIAPNGNSIRQGKQINLEASTVKKPSEDLEAPTLPDIETTTVQTTQTPTTIKPQEELLTTTPIATSVFTSPDVDHQTNHFLWSTTFDNWHSTMLDPITLNDGLSHTDSDETAPTVDDSSYTASTPTPTINYATTEQSVSTTSNIDPTTDVIKNENRRGKSLKDFSTEPSQDLSAITDTVVEKAKEIMGGMNSTTTEKLMNVMKKTKSKTVKRLILLLVQTCDDDHNTTAEASKKALLEALMAVSQKDMEEIAKEEGVLEAPTPEIDSYRRTDRFIERQEVRPRQDRRGKSLTIDPSAINSLSNPTTEKALTTEEQVAASTTQAPVRTSRRGVKKFGTRTTPIEPRTTKASFVEPKPTLIEPKPTLIDTPRAEARVAGKESDLKTASDTRALELLRSLYTIAARWG